MASPMVALKGPLMEKKDYSPNFPLKHAQKDMRFALGLGDKVGLRCGADTLTSSPSTSCVFWEGAFGRWDCTGAKCSSGRWEPEISQRGKSNSSRDGTVDSSAHANIVSTQRREICSYSARTIQPWQSLYMVPGKVGLGRLCWSATLRGLKLCEPCPRVSRIRGSHLPSLP